MRGIGCICLVQKHADPAQPYMKVLVTLIRVGDYRDLLFPELAGQQGLVANKVLAGLCNAGDVPGFVNVGPSRFFPIRRCEERVSVVRG
jgi:hypothetical protein